MIPNRKPDLADQVAKLAREVDRLKRRRVLTYTGDVPDLPTGTTIGGAGVGGALPEPGDPTALVLTWSAFHDAIAIRAEWTAPAAGEILGYEVQLREVTGPLPGDRQLVAVQTVIGTVATFRGVKPAQEYEVAVQAFDRLRQLSEPPLEGLVETGTDATVPAAPTGVAVSAGVRSIVVSWDEVADVDVAGGAGLYEVDVATAADFSTGLRTERTSSTILALTDLAVVGTTYYARVRAIDSSGNAGPNSATASSATGGVATDDIVTAGLSAAVVKFGVMAGDRIEANTLDVAALKTSTLLAKVITIGAGGRLQVGTGAPGLYVDDSGIRLFNPSGARMVFLDAMTGAAEFGGNVTSSATITGATMTAGLIRTAASSYRVELTPTSLGGVKPLFAQGLAFYSGQSQETGPAILHMIADPARVTGQQEEMHWEGAQFNLSSHIPPEIWWRNIRSGVRHTLQISAGENDQGRGNLFLRASVIHLDAGSAVYLYNPITQTNGEVIIAANGRIAPGAHSFPVTDSTSSSTGLQWGNSTNKFRVFWANNGTVQTSDARLKRGIARTPLGRGFIRKLKPVRYRWRDDPAAAPEHHGFTAQGVAEALAGEPGGFAGLVVPGHPLMVDENDQPVEAEAGLNYAEFIAPIVATLQEQDDDLEAVKRRLAAIEALPAIAQALSKR